MIVFIVDSVLSSATVTHGTKAYWRKDGGNWVRLPAPTSENPFHVVTSGGHGKKVVFAALSGWAFEDRVPACVGDFIRREAAGKPVTDVLFMCGVNSMKHDLTREYSPGVREGMRNLARMSFSALLDEVVSGFPGARVVYLGTSGFRKQRVPGDEGLFDQRTTTRVLRHRNKDMGEVERWAGRETVRAGGHFLNACRGITLADIADRHGHLTPAYLQTVLMNLNGNLFIQFDL